MKYQYWLANVPGITNRILLEMIRSAGSAEEVYHLKCDQLQKLCKMNGSLTQQLQESKAQWNVEQEYEKLQEKNIRFITQESGAYPYSLRNIADAPYGIYVMGELPTFEQKSVAIIGARMCSEYGRMMATEIGKRLAGYGVTVISGMARGIDAAGHLGALNGGGKTCAVLGCGVDVCYPESNRELYRQMVEQGCVISEYPPGQQPKPWCFPARNRIISALSDIVVVVEAKERSGSLITADFALEQGKDVYAVPGRTTDTLSRGCNQLIRQGAGIITNIDEFMEDLKLCVVHREFQENFNKLLLEKDESVVYSCVDLRPKSVEELMRNTGYTCQRLADVLQSLIQKDLVCECFKNFYIRKNEIC